MWVCLRLKNSGDLSGITSISSSQRAQYVEDKWQVADTLLLSLGLRNDQFTNYNSDGIAYIRQTKPQWAPRIGAAWDVHGDASFKVYANAGRYYLGLPLNPGLIVAAGFYNTTQLFTYSGIATDGSPTGLTQVSNEYSALNQFGQAPDPKTASARNLEPEYQDEYILGFEKTLGEAWTWGLKGMYRNLRNAIDDFCSMGQVVAAANAAGHDVQNYNTCYQFCNGEASPPGKQGRMPWMTQLDMGVTWSPAFAEHRLNFTASMLNVFDRQVSLQRYAFAMNTPSADASPNNPLFQTVTIRQSPRSLRLSVSYDF